MQMQKQSKNWKARTELLHGFLNAETLRYLIFGLLTVAVNITSYRVLALTLETMAANTIAFFIAVLFAYFTNSKYVFRVALTPKSFFKFMSMRIGTLAIDDGGMWLLTRLGWNDILAKCAVNILIILLNYLLSKLFIFKKKSEV